MKRLAICCAVAALALAGCSRPAPRTHLVVASVRQPATSLLFVAQGTGCLRTEGLSVDELPSELGRDALALLRDGKADVAVAFETPLLRAALEDDRLRVLTRLHTSTSNTRLVSRADAGILGFADLAGKRIGLARGTNAEFFVDVAVSVGGVDAGAVVETDLRPADAVAALGRGELDAAVLSDPYAARAEQLLGPAARTLETSLYAEASLLITRADVLAANTPALRALLRGLVCAERELRARPEETTALVVARFPEQPPAAVAAQLARVTREVGLDNVLLDVLRRERDWLVASTPAATAPDLRALVAADLLDAVDPESVTLLPGTGGLRW